MKKFIAAVAFLAAQPAYAGDAVIQWTPPTEYENGAPMLLSEILSYTIHYGSSPGIYTKQIEVPGTETSVTITNLSGTWYFAATATSTELEESGYSNEVTRTISKGRPKAPRIQ